MDPSGSPRRLGKPYESLHPPRGFSLLEILLSLSLAVVLMTAMGLAIDQSWRLSSQGQTEMQRQQIARAVLRIMERDLRSVMFVPPSEFAETGDAAATTSTSGTSSTASTTGSKSTGSSASGTSSANAKSTGTGSTSSSSASGSAGTSAGTTTLASGGTATEIVLASRGIRGDQLTIEIDGARPQKEIAYALPVNAAIPSSRTSDLRTIMYLLAGPGQAADPQGRGGLARKEGDRYAIASAETTGRDATGNFSTAVIAPEIIALEFRYFDGVTWLTSWDSVSMGALPRAVEVQIGFAPPESKKQAWLNHAVNKSTQTARLVMFLPASDPVPEETQP